MKPIFLDYMSTHPVDPACLNSYMKLTSEIFGNPQSLHSEGLKAAGLIEDAERLIVEYALGASLDDYGVLFTRNATEANRIVIEMFRYAAVFTSTIEHYSLYDAIDKTSSLIWNAIKIGVDQWARLKLSEIKKYAPLEGIQVLSSFMHANNEVGTVYDLKEIYESLRKDLLLKEEDIYFHTDMTCTLGKLPFNILDHPFIDLISFSGHKFGSLKEVGGIIYKKKTVGTAIDYYESSTKIGTIDAPRVYSMAELLVERCERIREAGLKGMDVGYNGQRGSGSRFLGMLRKHGVICTSYSPLHLPRLYNVISIRLHDIDSYDLLLNLDNVTISNGSACNSTDAKPSHVLLAMGLSDKAARECIRVSWDPFGDPNVQLEIAAKEIADIVKVIKETP